MAVRGGYYDGVVSTRREVNLSLEGGILRISGQGIDLVYPVDTITVTSGIGAIRRTIRLPDGGMCEVSGTSFLSQIERVQGKGKASAFLHNWERNLPMVLGALVLAITLVFAFVRYGLPVMAKKVAFALPPSVESSLGKETLTTLDGFIFKPTKLGQKRQNELESIFRRMTSTNPGGNGYRLLFRNSPALGANALALPSGLVVMTDGMVALAKNDEELEAVLAHELGHVRGRHLLRHVLQNSVTTLIMASVTGDILSVTSLSATIPTALIDAKFSRDFEREADDAAVEYLKREKIPLSRYADILARLKSQLDARKGEHSDGEPVRNYLSTHPPTDERIKRVLEGK
jgi:Zn-dependent protease with chaperone function